MKKIKMENTKKKKNHMKKAQIKVQTKENLLNKIKFNNKGKKNYKQ